MSPKLNDLLKINSEGKSMSDEVSFCGTIFSQRAEKWNIFKNINILTPYFLLFFANVHLV